MVEPTLEDLAKWIGDLYEGPYSSYEVSENKEFYLECARGYFEAEDKEIHHFRDDYDQCKARLNK